MSAPSTPTSVILKISDVASITIELKSPRLLAGLTKLPSSVKLDIITPCTVGNGLSENFTFILIFVICWSVRFRVWNIPPSPLTLGLKSLATS